MKPVKLVGKLEIDWYDFEDIAIDQYWSLRLSLRENDFDNRMIETIGGQL